MNVLNRMLFLPLFLLLASVSSAGADDLRVNAANRYVSLPAVQGMIDNMFSPEQAMSMLGAVPGMKPEERQAAGAAMSEALKDVRPQIERLMIKGAYDTFTTRELNALTAFYSTPEGESVLHKMPAMMSSVNMEMQQIIAGVVMRTLLQLPRQE